MLLQEVYKTVEVACGILGKQIKICELGNQLMKWRPEGVAKRYFLNNGALEHVSIDLNGKHGAIRLDLRTDLIVLNPNLKSYFDLVTNFGTTEHVDNQYMVFKNIDNFTKVNGVMIHTVPIIGTWRGHCNYHYSNDFFVNLSSAANYRVVFNELILIGGRVDRTLISSVLIKQKEDFVGELEFEKISKIVKG